MKIKKTHSRKVGRACSTVNDAAIRGYRVQLAGEDDDVTCSTCRCLLKKGDGRVTRLAERNVQRATKRASESVDVRELVLAIRRYERASSPSGPEWSRVVAALGGSDAQKDERPEPKVRGERGRL